MEVKPRYIYETVILIPSYNGKRLLDRCLRSLRSQQYQNFKALVVDDASTDGTADYLRAHFPEVEVVTLPDNVGFARAVNAGFRHILSAYAPKYIATLNNDTEAAPAWLSALVRQAERDTRIAAVASNMLFADHPEIINSQGGTLDWNSDGYDVNFGIRRTQGKQGHGPVFSACFGAALVRAAALRDVGLLDERFGAYFEDLDWSWRANLFGYTIVFAHDAVVYHAGSASYGNDRYQKLYLCKRNALCAVLKNRSHDSLARELSHILLGYWFSIVGYFQTSKHHLSLGKKFLFASIPFAAFAWNLAHLPETLRMRREIQGHRRVLDGELEELMAQDKTPVREWLRAMHPFPRRRAAVAARSANRNSRLERFLLDHGCTRLHSKMYLELGFLSYLTGRVHALYNAFTKRPINPHTFTNVSRFNLDNWGGVNIFGFLDSESGVGEAARSLVRAAEAAHIPHALINSTLAPHRRRETAYVRRFSTSNPYATNVIAIYGDVFAHAVRNFGQEAFEGRRTIAYWAWELETLPKSWAKLLRHVDEVWCPSNFTAAAVRAARPHIPVTVIPHAIAAPNHSFRPRAHFRLPKHSFLFLFTFDFYSIFERKNPLAVIRAFRRAFPARDQKNEKVGLVIKCSNPEADPKNFQALARAAEDDPRIHLIAGYLERGEVTSLMNICDAYVSLHRSEGFGLAIAEAMRLAKPVIATNYSGNTDFMTEANSFPVPYTLVPLAKNFGPYRKDNRWAEPDETQASKFMRLVYDHPEIAARKGLRARYEVTERFSPEAVGRLIEKRLRAFTPSRE